MRESLNSEFHQDYLMIDRKLSLDSLLSLREAFTYEYCKEVEIEPFIVSAGWTYFQSVLGTGEVNSMNYKKLAAACLLLAFKFYEETHLEKTTLQMESLIKSFHHFEIKATDVLKNEFFAYYLLHFNLHLEEKDYRENYELIVNHYNTFS